MGTYYAYQPSALGTYRRRRAALSQGPTYSTYWLRVPASGVGYVPRTVAPQVSTAAQLVARDNQGVLYKGQELVHYRPALPEGLELMQVVFAWRVPNPVSCNG